MDLYNKKIPYVHIDAGQRVRHRTLGNYANRPVSEGTVPALQLAVLLSQRLTTFHMNRHLSLPPTLTTYSLLALKRTVVTCDEWPL